MTVHSIFGKTEPIKVSFINIFLHLNTNLHIPFHTSIKASCKNSLELINTQSIHSFTFNGLLLKQNAYSCRCLYFPCFLLNKIKACSREKTQGRSKRHQAVKDQADLLKKKKKRLWTLQASALANGLLVKYLLKPWLNKQHVQTTETTFMAVNLAWSLALHMPVQAKGGNMSSLDSDGEHQSEKERGFHIRH